jgi:hypothetical protein
MNALHVANRVLSLCLALTVLSCAEDVERAGATLRACSTASDHERITSPDVGSRVASREVVLADGASRTPSGTPVPPLFFPCGDSICNAASQYCYELNGIITSYSCVDHAPCAGSLFVSCSCLHVPGSNWCKDQGGGATLNWGGG